MVECEYILAGVICYYLAISIVAFAFYLRDKLAAQEGGWRVPELKLHFLRFFLIYIFIGVQKQYNLKN